MRGEAKLVLQRGKRDCWTLGILALEKSLPAVCQIDFCKHIGIDPVSVHVCSIEDIFEKYFKTLSNLQ